MRPVEKGAGPANIEAYGDAKPDLITNLGTYCSYCELPITLNAHIDVEHKNAKAYKPELKESWENFLISCTMCNSKKSRLDGLPKTVKAPARDFKEDDYLWPDRDNTFLALTYNENGIVVASQTNAMILAERTIHLFDLNNVKNPMTDNRLDRRKNAWRIAKQKRALLEKWRSLGASDSDLLDDLLVLVTENGFWSVWMTLFGDVHSVRKALIQKFSGTAADCFDGEGNPIQRTGPNSRI